MNNKKIIWISFVLLVLLQLWVPASVIRKKENILSVGAAFKFRTAPRDPNDYLRGKYVYLDFRENSFDVKGDAALESGQEIYVDITSDSAGFAKITAVNTNKKNAGATYIKTTVGYVSSVDSNITRIHINWPFDRLYMEETKAPLAEEAYNESRIDSSIVSYALIKIKNGDAVLQDLYIDNKPIKEYIKK